MNLIYLVAVGTTDPRFYESIQWSVHSLRHWGKFTDEILVVTDNTSPKELVGVKDYAQVLQVEADALCDSNHQRSDHDKYQIARLLIHHLVDLNRYDLVMYVDADVLAIQDVNSLFQGVKEFRYSREFQPMSAPMFSELLTDEELSEAKWHRAINSGVYVAPTHYLSECLDTWKAVLDTMPLGPCYDQPALNAAVFRKMFRAKPLPMFSVGYPVLANFSEHFRPQTQLLHYCGNRRQKFARMGQHYEALLANQPLQIHFQLNEDREIVPDDVNEQRPWVLGEARRSWIIAIDDREGIESHALVNQRYAQELELRGHRVISLAQARNTRPDLVIHHNYTKDFLTNTFIEGVPHIAVRTSDFGPHPPAWVRQINTHYQQLWVHTEWTRQNALSGGVEEHRVRVIPHGVDTQIFTPLGKPYQLSTDKSFRFLFVGGAAIRKGIDILLQAYTLAFEPKDDVCLVIKDSSKNVFYQDNRYREQIIQMTCDPKVPEIIHLDGHLSSLDLAALYRACTIGVWPYRAEGFLIPALECMGCGTPTLLPEIGPTMDFSSPRTSFLVPTINVKLPLKKLFRMRLGFEIEVESVNLCEIKPDVLAKFMRLAFESDREILKAKGAASIVMAHGRYSWSHSIDLIERCISELI